MLRDAWFEYMPKGSYAIHTDGTPIFLKEVSEDLKERFIKDLKAYQEEYEDKSKSIFNYVN